MELVGQTDAYFTGARLGSKDMFDKITSHIKQKKRELEIKGQYATVNVLDEILEDIHKMFHENNKDS